MIKEQFAELLAAGVIREYHEYPLSDFVNEHLPRRYRLFSNETEVNVAQGNGLRFQCPPLLDEDELSESMTEFLFRHSLMALNFNPEEAPDILDGNLLSEQRNRLEHWAECHLKAVLFMDRAERAIVVLRAWLVQGHISSAALDILQIRFDTLVREGVCWNGRIFSEEIITCFEQMENSRAHDFVYIADEWDYRCDFSRAWQNRNDWLDEELDEMLYANRESERD